MVRLGPFGGPFIDCRGRLWLADHRWSWNRRRIGREATLENEIRKARLYGQSQES